MFFDLYFSVVVVAVFPLAYEVASRLLFIMGF